MAGVQLVEQAKHGSPTGLAEPVHERGAQVVAESLVSQLVVVEDGLDPRVILSIQLATSQLCDPRPQPGLAVLLGKGTGVEDILGLH